MNFEKILVLAPHTDDGELGCGASINKWINQGKEVYYMAFSAAEESVPEGFPKDALRKEVIEATRMLGIRHENVIVLRFPVRELSYHRQEVLDEMIKVKNNIKPDLVLLPSQNDVHQDHKVVSDEGIRAFKDSNLLAYEMPWNNLEFKNTAFSIVNEENIKTKVEALKCYETQKNRSYLNDEFIKGWAKYRGVQVKQHFSECFEIIRMIF